MSATALIAQLKAAGIRISRHGDNLLAEPRVAVTARLLTLIRANKPELLAALPDAQRADQDARRTLEPAEFAELRALIDAVALFNGFTADQTAEARQIAEADAVAALECFRVLAAGIRVAKSLGIGVSTIQRIQTAT